MEKREFRYKRIMPGDPEYRENAPEIDALGGKPVSLVSGLHFAEGFLHKAKKSGDKKRILECEKDKSEIEKVIAWAEARKPGSSRNGNGSILLMEYEEEQTLKNKQDLSD